MSNGMRVATLMLAGWFSHGGSMAGSERTGPPAGAVTLQEAVRLTLERSPEVALAEAQAARALEALREARAGKMPQILAGTGLAYNNGFPLSIEGSAPSAFQIGMSQPLFSRRIGNLVREAAEGARSGKDLTDAARNDLAARTAAAYAELHYARELAAAWTGRLQAAERETRRVEDQLTAGRVRPLELIRAESDAASCRHRLLAAQETALVAESALRTLAGMRESGPVATVEPSLSSEILGMPAEAIYQHVLESHPEIRQSEAAVRAREFRVEAEKGGNWPRFDLVSQYALFTKFNNYQDYFNRFTRNNYLFGLSIQVPLFDGSATGARVARSRQEAAEARLELERLRSELRSRIERDASALRVARSGFDLVMKEERFASENAKVGRALLESGRISPGEAAAFEAKLIERQAELVEARRALFLRQVDLLRSAGALPGVF